MNTHDVLREIVGKVRCKAGWHFALIEEDGFKRLRITVDGTDNAAPEAARPFRVSHLFPVPEATYNRPTWVRWVFDRCLGVENHEVGECFRIGADRPFQPLHGPGEDPYTVHEFRPAIDALTTQDGSIRAPYPADDDR